MATKKKTKKASTKSKRVAPKKATQATPMKAAKRAKKLAKKKPAAKKSEKKNASAKKQRKTSKRVRTLEFLPEGRRSRSGEQSGDLQGLSRLEGADSESVDELLAEGNAFEADAVIGVEDAESADEKEVRTHEVSEDDVPAEYLDKE